MKSLKRHTNSFVQALDDLITDTPFSPVSRSVDNIYECCKNGDLEAVKNCIKKSKDDLNKKIPAVQHGTPLLVACDYGHIELVKFLLSKKCAIDAINDFGNSALHISCEREFFDIIKLLLSAKIEVDMKNESGQTPLHIASNRGNLEIAKLLISHNAQVDIFDICSNTPLHFASRGNHLEIVKLLLANKAVINFIDMHGMTALHHAAREGNVEVVRCLLQNNARIDAMDRNRNTPLMLACRANSVDTARILIISGADVKTKSNNDSSLLHICAKEGNIELAKLLLQSNVPIDAVDFDGDTPLHIAAIAGKLDMIQFLLANKADLNQSNMNGITALHYACINSRSQHLAVVQYLVTQRLLDINTRETTTGDTPLHSAAKAGNLEIVKILVHYNADITARNSNGHTAEQEAALAYHTEISQYFSALAKEQTAVQSSPMSSPRALVQVPPIQRILIEMDKHDEELSDQSHFCLDTMWKIWQDLGKQSIAEPRNLYDTVQLHYIHFKLQPSSVGRKITAICDDIMETVVKDDVAYKYYKEGILDYDEHIHQGIFYDIARRGDFRPLSELRNEKHDPHEPETIVVDINEDDNLAIVVAQVQQLLEKTKTLKRAYQVIAKVVDEFVRNINAGNATEQRAKEGHVLHIGHIKGGVGRHRAILFKYMCDRCCTHDLPLRSRLVKCADDPQHAWNVIKAPTSNSTFIVDTMHSPGKLLSEDELEGLRYRRGDFASYGGNSVRGIFQFQLQHKNTNKMKELGTGASGTVYAVNVVTTDNKVISMAMKSIDTSVFDKEVFLRELDLLQYVKHKNVIKYYMSKDEMLVINNVQQKRLCMYMELMDMSADAFMKKALTLSSNYRYYREIMYILLGAARGIRYLHSRNITHRDIKPMNILLRIDPIFNIVTDVKIADFGLSKVLSETLQTQTIVGTPGYLAPEIEDAELTNQPYNATVSDIYSFGITMGELLCMQRPRKNGFSDEDLIKAAGSDPMLLALVDLYKKCTERDPLVRSSINFDTDVCDKLMELIYTYL